MPAFLPKGVRSNQRIKNRIKIDIDQVVEVPEILACDRIAGLIGKVIALRKVFSEPFMSSTNGSLTGYLREPQSTACSRM